jgi:hypothetical protein
LVAALITSECKQIHVKKPYSGNCAVRELLGFVYCIQLLYSCHRDENPGIHEELPDVFLFNPQRNLIQQYATTSYLGAYERFTEANGIYVNHLKKHLAKDILILDILKMVRKGE